MFPTFPLTILTLKSANGVLPTAAQITPVRLHRVGRVQRHVLDAADPWRQWQSARRCKRPYRAIALRSFDPAMGTWAIWWLDARNPHAIDVPVVGRFAERVGSFYANDTLERRPIRLRFLWLRTDSVAPRWEQAMSADDGETWETNWTMDFERA